MPLCHVHAHRTLQSASTEHTMNGGDNPPQAIDV